MGAELMDASASPEMWEYGDFHNSWSMAEKFYCKTINGLGRLEQKRPCCVVIVASGLRSVSAVCAGAGWGRGSGAGIQPVSQLASCEQHGAATTAAAQHQPLYAAHQGRTLQLLHVMARISAVSCTCVLRRSRPGDNCNGKYLWKPF